MITLAIDAMHLMKNKENQCGAPTNQVIAKAQMTRKVLFLIQESEFLAGYENELKRARGGGGVYYNRSTNAFSYVFLCVYIQ